MPNIVLILADDLGYGDVSCMNPSSRIRTTAIDALAAEGMRFTDAHSTSAVCSPSRYSVLTGRYNWRSTLQRGIVGVYGDPLIDADRLTLPRMLQKRGYHTAAIGKWHLGMGWDFEPDEEDFFPGGGRQATDGQRDRWRAAFDKPTIGGPCTRGFDAYFGVDVPNWPPYAFIEHDRLVGVPSELLPDRLVGNNLASYSGPAMPYWHFEQLLPAWAHRADAYIADRARSDEPFFLYLALTSPHTPLSVNKPWIGASGLNSLYADLVLETDHVVGQVMESLDRYGLSDSTLVIFTSDNGCAPYIGVAELEAQGHRPSAEYRGYKSDAWDGGHRVPFIVRWPGKVAAGTTQSALVSQTDLMATMAQVVGASLPANAGEDSYSMMPL
ncbi:MAG TPA: arylsulfatase, partial [Spirochaetia bacterium]|nr:arylsulfatase [Spirochaetia bacterium]